MKIGGYNQRKRVLRSSMPGIAMCLCHQGQPTVRPVQGLLDNNLRESIGPHQVDFMFLGQCQHKDRVGR